MECHARRGRRRSGVARALESLFEQHLSLRITDGAKPGRLDRVEGDVEVSAACTTTTGITAAE